MAKIITNIQTLDNLEFEATFADGEVVLFDVKTLFNKFPQFKALENNNLFSSLKIDGHGYGVSWNDDLDLASGGIYSRGKHVRKVDPNIKILVGQTISEIRNEKGISQRELSKKTGIMQAEICKIEQGKGNPTLTTLEKIAKCLGRTVASLVI